MNLVVLVEYNRGKYINIFICVSIFTPIFAVDILYNAQYNVQI